MPLDRPSAPPDLDARKAAVRARMKAFLATVTQDQRAAASLALTPVMRRAIESFLPNSGIVAVFASQSTEVDLGPFVAGGGFRFAYPAIVGSELVFRECAPGSLVPAGSLFEPPPDAPEVVPDVFVVPGRAFDAAGRRIGRGKGYYDRALSRCPAIRAVGVCFSGQLVDEVPVGPQDVPVDLVVTEAGALRCDPGRGRGRD